MRIVVTGGTGFIGSAVVAHAEKQGHEVWTFDRTDGFWIQDLDHIEDRLVGAEVVIHLAGMLGTSELFYQAYEAVDANIKGTLNILNWCRDNGAGYVGITMPDSSWANVYQATKLAAMRLATAWHRQYDVPVSHVRAFNVYGPGQKHGPGHPQKFLPTFATRAWAGDLLPIFGSGLQTLDPVHVDDVARMLVDAIRFGDDEIFDAGTGTAVAVRTFASTVIRMTGSESKLHYLPMRAGETEDTYIRAQGEGWEALGWSPGLDWDKVQEAVNWYRPSDPVHDRLGGASQPS